MQAFVGQHFLEPLGADKDALTRPPDVLKRIIDHGHQWNYGAEGNDDKNR